MLINHPRRTVRRAARIALPCLVSIGLSAPAGAADGGQLAADHGCLGCHSGHEGFGPSLKRLADKAGLAGASDEALQHGLREMREKTAVHTHVFTSDQTALAILKWIAQGAK